MRPLCSVVEVRTLLTTLLGVVAILDAPACFFRRIDFGYLLERAKVDAAEIFGRNRQRWRCDVLRSGYPRFARQSLGLGRL